jgi:ribosome biogenesis GTPase
MRAQIVHVLPRRTWFSRKSAGRETTEQVVAANVDHVFLVFGLDLGVNVRAIERYLVVARRSRVGPVVVLNKMDVVADVAACLDEALASADGAPVVAVSAVRAIGMERLESFLAPGKTVALLGPSGGGKSSLVNRLVGRQDLPTGGVREWDARGRHTSVHRQLVVRERGGLIIDTPGMRELQLWESDAVDDAFGDVADLAAACRFRDCRHDKEPGCAVKAGVDAGLISPARHESFLKLQAEREDVERKRDERALAEAKRLGRAGAKAMRSFQNAKDQRDP